MLISTIAVSLHTNHRSAVAAIDIAHLGTCRCPCRACVLRFVQHISAAHYIQGVVTCRQCLQYGSRGKRHSGYVPIVVGRIRRYCPYGIGSLLGKAYCLSLKLHCFLSRWSRKRSGKCAHRGLAPCERVGIHIVHIDIYGIGAVNQLIIRHQLQFPRTAAEID